MMRTYTDSRNGEGFCALCQSGRLRVQIIGKFSLWLVWPPIEMFELPSIASTTTHKDASRWAPCDAGVIGASVPWPEQLATMLWAYTGRDDSLKIRKKPPLLSCAANSAAKRTCKRRINYSVRSTSIGYLLLQLSSYLSVRRYAPDSENNGKVEHLSTKELSWGRPWKQLRQWNHDDTREEESFQGLNGRKEGTEK